MSELTKEQIEGARGFAGTLMEPVLMNGLVDLALRTEAAEAKLAEAQQAYEDEKLHCKSLYAIILKMEADEIRMLGLVKECTPDANNG